MERSLAEIIKDNAQEPDSEYFKDKQQLIDVTQEFTELYGSERLIEILESVFNEEPTSLQYHQLLTPNSPDHPVSSQQTMTCYLRKHTGDRGMLGCKGSRHP